MSRCDICGQPLSPHEEPQVCAEPDCGRVGHEWCGDYDHEPSGVRFWRCHVCWDAMQDGEWQEEAGRDVL